MTNYFITSPEGLEYKCFSADEEEAFQMFCEDTQINASFEQIENEGYEFHEIASLEDLLEYLKNWNDEYTQSHMADLPVFGGEEPSNTSEIWSWDNDNLLVGTCSEDFRICSRKEWGVE